MLSFESHECNVVEHLWFADVCTQKHEHCTSMIIKKVRCISLSLYIYIYTCIYIYIDR